MAQIFMILVEVVSGSFNCQLLDDKKTAYLLCSLGLLKWVACLAMRMNIDRQTKAVHPPETARLN